MKKSIFVLLFTLGLVLTSCSRYSFIKTGTANHLAPQDENCPIIVYQTLEPGFEYTELGICNAIGEPWGIFDDPFVDAVEQAKECACEQGGNAVFITNVDRVKDSEGGVEVHLTAMLMIVDTEKILRSR